MTIQLLVDGIISGSAYALVALGFALIYNTTKIFHFAHGAIYTLSAYLFYTCYNLWNWPFFAAIILTIVVISILGIAIDEIIYMPLVRKKASSLIHLLSSLGLYIVIINLIAMVYGNDTKVLNPGVQTTYSIGPVIFTKIRVATLISFIVLLGSLILLLRRTRLGKTLRAMRDDPDLISVIGINPQIAHKTVFAIGSSLAAVSAVLVALDSGIDPHIGMTAVQNSAVAAIVGGVGSFEGAALGGLMLGLLQSLAVWKISAQWQNAITFLVLILFLLFRPQGLIGSRRRVEEVRV